MSTIKREYTMPEYANAGIKSGQIIGIDTFLQTVQNIGEAYLGHECSVDELNGAPPEAESLPSKASPGFGSDVWKISVSDLRSQLDGLRASFKSKNDHQLVAAEATWTFLVAYFYRLCRLHEYRFSYFESDSDDEVTQRSCFGLGDPYFQSAEQYRAAAEGIKSSAEIACGKLIAAGDSAAVEGVVDACEKLCKLNADMEVCHDYGRRNIKSQVTKSVVLDTLYAASATDVYFWWSTLDSKARNYASQHGITSYHVTTEIEGWGGGATKHVAYMSYKVSVLKKDSPDPIERKVHNTNVAVLTIRNVDAGLEEAAGGDSATPQEGRCGTTQPAAGAYEFEISDPPQRAMVTAYPNKNCRFLCWNGDASLTSTTIELTMDKDREAAAWMLSGKYLVTLNTQSAGGDARAQGAVDAVGWTGARVDYDAGSTATVYSCAARDKLSVLAFPASYCELDGWYSDSGTKKSDLTCYELGRISSNQSLTARFKCSHAGLVLNLASGGGLSADQTALASRAPSQEYHLRVSRSEFKKEDGTTEVAGYAKILDVGPTGTATVLVETTDSSGASWVTQVAAAIEEPGHALSAVVGGAGGRAEIWTTDFPTA